MYIDARARIYVIVTVIVDVHAYIGWMRVRMHGGCGCFRLCAWCMAYACACVSLRIRACVWCMLHVYVHDYVYVCVFYIYMYGVREGYTSSGSLPRAQQTVGRTTHEIDSVLTARHK